MPVNPAHRNLQAISIVVFACALTGVYCAAASRVGQSVNKCVACHKNNGEEAMLYADSIHAAKGISCSRCHGGNASASEKEAGHSGQFVGKPDSAQTIRTCGSCHTAELTLFKTSRHFPEKKGTARLDCVQCHGAHTTGSPSRNFSFAYFCSGCHGLEYLPELNRPFQKMLEVADAQNDAVNAMRKSGSTPDAEAVSLRQQTRKLVGEIVHGTDYEGGREKIPQILKLNEEFKKAVSSRR